MTNWIKLCHLEAAQKVAPHLKLMPNMKSHLGWGLLAQKGGFVCVLAWAEAGVLLAWDLDMCDSPYQPPSSSVHLKAWDGFFLDFMGWRKIGKKGSLRAHVVKPHISLHFGESFYESNKFKLENHFYDNIPHLITYFMDNYLKFFCRLIRRSNGC